MRHWKRNLCLLPSRCPKFGKRVREQFCLSVPCRSLTGWPPLLSPKSPLPQTSQGVERLGRQLSGQVNFEPAEALGCWELAPAPSGLASQLTPTPGNVRGTCRTSRGGSAGACVPATHPQVVAPGPSSSGKLGQRQYLRQGVQPPKESFWPEGPVRSNQTDVLTGRPLCTRLRQTVPSGILGMTEDTAVIEP